MATWSHGLDLEARGAPGLDVSPSRPAESARSGRQLVFGVALACLVATGLALSRLIDVSSNGKAMLLFGISFSMAVAGSAVLAPRWYIPLIVAYLPFSKAYPLLIGGITGLNMTNLLLVLSPIAWISRRRTSRLRVPLGSTEPLVALFVTVASLSLLPALLAGESPFDLLTTYRAWLAPILLFFVARGLVRDRNDVAGILRVLAWTVFLVAVCTWKEGFDRAGRGSIDSARVPGLMEQANSMGAFLAYYGAPLLAFAVTERPWLRKLAHLGAYLVAARVTLYTFSRGAYLAFSAGSTSALLLAKPLLLVTAGTAGLFAASLYPALIPDSVRDRLSATALESVLDPIVDPANSLDRSSAMRLVLWRGATRMIARHPLVGVGLGQFPARVPFYTDQPLTEDDPGDAHNAYLLIAAEMGLPSLALLAALYFAWGFTAVRLYWMRRDPLDRQLGLFFLASLAAVVVSCMLGSRFSDEALIGYFWILAALVVVVGRMREPRRGA